MPLVAVVLLVPGLAVAQEVGDEVLLSSENSEGVPVHPSDGDNSYVRWPNGSRGEILEVGRWFLVEAPGGDQGWITAKYLTVVLEEGDEPSDTGPKQPFRVIGSWNLEHFKMGKARGFPEDRFGGPTYSPDERDLAAVAGVIRDELGAAVLALSEINGAQASDPPRSVELDLLVEELGSGWDYEISSDGRTQRVALLHDSSKARRRGCHEFPNLSGPRNHLGFLSTLLAADGSEMNDLVVIGVHLKSGQRNNFLHDQEMADLANGFAEAFDGEPFSASELDVVITGDFNANFYDTDLETFWTDFGGSLDLEVLAPEDVMDYPPTRLTRVPLRPGSLIDYVMATTVSGGLADDLVRSTAHVHHELLISPFEDFRRKLSDHIP